MRKITRICRDNISAEIFQPSAFSMAGGIFFGGFSNGDNRYGEDWKKDKRDKEKIRNDDQTGTGSLRDICCCGVQWQNGQAMPTLDNLIILADLWDVKMDDLIVRQVS